MPPAVGGPIYTAAMTRRPVAALTAVLAVCATFLMVPTGTAGARQPILGPAAKAGGWAPVTTNSLTAATDNSVIAADCAGTRCTAVGLLGDSLDSGRATVISHRAGGQAAIARRMRGAAVGTLPADISCPTRRWCVVVGSIHATTPSDKTWAVVGAGRSWQQVRTPSPGNGSASQAYLTGVSCRSDSDCVAVGYYFNRSGVTRALVLRWDGDGWARVLRRQLVGRMLTAVDCTDSGECLIAATAGEQAEFWWLTSSTLTPIRGGGTPTNQYTDVSCVSDTWCAAAGGIVGASPTLAIVSVSAAGRWRWVPKPVRTSRATGGFNSITCFARAECLAGTSWLTAGGYSHPGIWEWSGGAKRTTRMVGSRGRIGQVSDIACTTSRCVASGQSYAAGGDTRLLNNTYQRRR